MCSYLRPILSLQSIIRIGGRSESLTMQSLGIADARKSVRFSRSPEQYAALASMKTSIQGLKSGFAQSRVFRDETAPFHNCTLARLSSILGQIAPRGGDIVADLIQR